MALASPSANRAKIRSRPSRGRRPRSVPQRPRPPPPRPPKRPPPDREGGRPLSPRDRLVLMGVFGSPQGVRGALRVKSLTREPAAIGAYGPLTDGKCARVFAFES